MHIIAAIVLQLLIGGLLLWGAIYLVDEKNPKNKFEAAMGWSLVMAGSAIVPLIGGAIGVVLLGIICIRYYDLGLLRTIGVLVLEAFVVLMAAALREGGSGHAVHVVGVR